MTRSASSPHTVVGEREEGDIPNVVGKYGVGSRNERGKMLIEWALSQRLGITNTMFQKPFETLPEASFKKHSSLTYPEVELLHDFCEVLLFSHCQRGKKAKIIL